MVNSGRSQVVCSEDTQAALWGGPCAEASVSANTQEGQRLLSNSHSGGGPSLGAQVRASDNCSPGRQLDCNLMRDLEPEPPG